MTTPTQSPRPASAGDRWSPGSERRSIVLASSDQLHLKRNRHKLYICDDADQDRLVEFSFNVKEIPNFADFYYHVKRTLDVRACDVGQHYKSVMACCYALNIEQSEALLQITVVIAPSTLMLCTGADVFLHYVRGLRVAGYRLRKHTKTVCMRRCLIRQQRSINRDYSPMMRALFLDVIHKKTAPLPPPLAVPAPPSTKPPTPPQTRWRGGGGITMNGEVRYRRHSANLDRAAEVYYPAASALSVAS